MKKIDIHCHATKRKLEHAEPESADIEAILQEMEVYGVEKTVLLATYFPHKGSGITNYRMHHWIEDRKELLMFGSLDFEHYFYQGLNELEEMADEGLIRGIKIYATYQKIDFASEKFAKVVSIAKRYGLPMMMHSGCSHGAQRAVGKPTIEGEVKPSEMAVAAQQGVEVLYSHMAGKHLDDLIEVVRQHPNVSTDMSGLINSKTENDEIPERIEEIKKFLEHCGPSRLLFGTDFPIQTHKDSIYLLEKAMEGFTNSDKKLVYYENAKRLLKL